MSRTELGRDVESRDSLETEEVKEEEKRGDWLVRSLFSVLRREVVREGDKEEAERREDEVEQRLEGWREEQEGGCVANFMSGEQAWDFSKEV